MKSKKELGVLLITLFLSACTKLPFGTTDNTAVKKPEVAKENIDSTANTLVSKYNPGPYETLLKGDLEARLARFPRGAYGGELRIACCGAEPKTFNPWVAEDAFSLELSNLLFRGLADLDNYSGQVIPDLAAEIKDEAEHLSYLIRLRKGLSWSDGHPIKANDLLFTWNKILAEGYASQSLRNCFLVDGKMPECNILDELTVRIKLPRPSAPFKRKLAAFKIAPQHILESLLDSKEARIGFKQLWSADRDCSNLVSDGPFRLLTYVPAQKVEFIRSENFYMLNKSGERLPYLQNLVFTLAPDQGAVLLEFGKMNADLARVRPRDFAWLSSQQEKQNFKLFDLGPSMLSSFLVFNLNSRIDQISGKPYVDPIKSKWFNDSRFRQALNHVIDRQRLSRICFNGVASPLVSALPPFSPYYNADLKAFPADLKYAEALLSSAGFTRKKDGFLCDQESNRIEFTVSYAEKSHFYEAVLAQLSRDLAKLGIVINSAALNAAEIQDILNGRKKWEAQLFSIAVDPLEPDSNADFYRSNGRLHIFDQREVDKKGLIQAPDARDWELALDKIFESGLSEFDFQKRKKLYGEAEKIVYEQAPCCYLIEPHVILACRNRVKNFDPTPLSQASLGLHNIEEIYTAELPSLEGEAKNDSK
ncbi:MAG: hypothetical protein K2X27_02755 [Candidatus Obscuribacterales bacterium]|nr:hypothetical protein [Candidatus Obscuribacterales bacterium]